MSHQSLLALLSLCPAMTLAVLSSSVAVAQEALTPRPLAPVVDRFQVKKEQWTVTDRDWLQFTTRSDGFGGVITGTLKCCPDLARGNHYTPAVAVPANSNFLNLIRKA